MSESENSRPYVFFPPPTATPWPSAIQNVAAISAMVFMAHEKLITGDWAAGFILAIIGVVTVPHLTKRTAAPTLGIITLAFSPLVRMVVAAFAAKGA